MKVRRLDILHLPLLPRYRRKVLTLDNARFLTRGDPLGAAALLAYLNPRRHIYTAVAVEGDNTLMGQVILDGGETSARLTFLAPGESADGLTLPLLDHLSLQAGEWGAFHLLAEVDEHAAAFKRLRHVGFAMYAWQRIWKLAAPPDVGTGLAPVPAPLWRAAASSELIAIQSLHGQIVPALLQPVDSAPRKADGMVSKTKGELKAYVSVEAGPLGIWLQPLIHPDSDCVPDKMAALLHDLPRRAGSPVYLCVRSYQAWLESVLEDLGAEAGPRQAVMVKHLAKLQKAEERIPAVKPSAVSVQPSGMSRVSKNKA